MQNQKDTATAVKITKINPSCVEGILTSRIGLNIPIHFNGSSVRFFSNNEVSIDPSIVRVCKNSQFQYSISNITLESIMGRLVIGGIVQNSEQSTVVIPIEQIKLISCDRYNALHQEWFIFLS